MYVVSGEAAGADSEAAWFAHVGVTLEASGYAVVAEQSLSPRTDKTFRTPEAFSGAPARGLVVDLLFLVLHCRPDTAADRPLCAQRP